MQRSYRGLVWIGRTNSSFLSIMSLQRPDVLNTSPLSVPRSIKYLPAAHFAPGLLYLRGDVNETQYSLFLQNLPPVPAISSKSADNSRASSQRVTGSTVPCSRTLLDENDDGSESATRFVSIIMSTNSLPLNITQVVDFMKIFYNVLRGTHTSDLSDP